MRPENRAVSGLGKAWDPGFRQVTDLVAAAAREKNGSGRLARTRFWTLLCGSAAVYRRRIARAPRASSAKLAGSGVIVRSAMVEAAPNWLPCRALSPQPMLMVSTFGSPPTRLMPPVPTCRNTLPVAVVVDEPGDEAS